MTIPRRNSRPIRVNGRQYRWMVKSLGDCLRLTVEDQKTGELHQRRLASWESALTPRFVKEFILYRFEQPPAG